MPAEEPVPVVEPDSFDASAHTAELGTATEMVQDKEIASPAVSAEPVAADAPMEPVPCEAPSTEAAVCPEEPHVEARSAAADVDIMSRPQTEDIHDGAETCDSSIGLAVDTMLDDVQTSLMHEFGSTDGSSLGGGIGDRGSNPTAASTQPDVDEDACGKRKSSKEARKSGITFAEPGTAPSENAVEAALESLAGADSTDAAPATTSIPSRASVHSKLGLSMRRGYTRAPSAVNDADLTMDIEPMEPHAAAGSEGGEATAPLPALPKADVPEVVPMIGPDPTMAWKADVMRTLRASGGRPVKVETLLGMVPHPTHTGGGGYRAQLEEHLIDRRLAVWAEDGYAVQLA